jgi:hypothetical protein
MTLKQLTTIGLITAACAAFTSDACAGNKLTRQARARHADKNKDGTVTARELKQEKKWERNKKAEVNTPREAKADANNDGVIDKEEAAAIRDALGIS